MLIIFFPMVKIFIFHQTLATSVIFYLIKLNPELELDPGLNIIKPTFYSACFNSRVIGAPGGFENCSAGRKDSSEDSEYN